MPKRVEKKRAKKVKTVQGHIDLPFMLLTVLLVVIGLIMVLSSSYPSAFYDIDEITGHDAFYFFKKQAGFALLGFGVMYIISRLNYQGLRGLAFTILIISFVLMAAVIVPGLGVSAHGATRWLRYPIRFQPSEVGKMGVILFFAARLSKREERTPRLYNRRKAMGRFLNLLERIGFIELIPYVAVLGIVTGLLLLEPHMSATIQIFVVAAAILFAAGISLGWFAVGGLGVGGALAFIIANTSYMTSRIQLWRDPWSDPLDKGYQAIQSLLAIGSGGLLGLGLGNSRQKFLYLPEEHNDFIFSVACEELGLVGAILILLLFALLILRGYWLAVHARDRFGSLVIVGIVTLIAFQVFLNVAVVTNLFPVTGISLPFFSYGGTALVIQMAEMGIVLSISRQNPVTKPG